MREYAINIDSALANGLSPDKKLQRNAPYMNRMQNARATEFGATSPERVTYPVGSVAPTISWPFPQLIREERVTLELGATTVHTVSDTAWTKSAVTTYDPATPASTKAIVRGGLWHMAAFRDTYFLTNGTSFVWKIPSNTSDKTFCHTDITVQALTRHRDRLFMAGVAGTWFTQTRFLKVLAAWRETLPEGVFVHEDVAIDTGFAFWCEPGGGADDIPFHCFLCAMGFFGDTAFDKMEEKIITLVEEGKIGIAWIRTPGTVRSIKGLGTNVIVYGAEGISALQPVGNGYVEDLVLATGIPGRGCAGGSDAEHCFIDNQDYTWRFAQQSVPQRLGYRQYTHGQEVFIRTFGSYGASSGLLAPPCWIAVNERSVYVSDNGNDRVQEFDLNGNHVANLITDVTGPTAIAVYEDEIYVVDNANSRIRVYNLSGTYQRQFGSYGTGNGAFIGCFGISVYSSEVYLTDAGNDRVQVFSTAGVYARKWGTNGTGNTNFTQPYGISVTKCGKVLVTDQGNNRVLQFRLDGTYIKQWGSFGADDSEFTIPSGVARLNDEEIYVVDQGNDRIQVFDLAGTFIRKYGENGTGNGNMNGPLVCALQDERLYLADTGNARIQVLDPDFTVTMVISYDPVNQEYWFATNTGSYILSRTGMGGPCDSRPTSLWRDNVDRLVGCGETLDDDGATMLLRTQALDLGERGTKQVDTLQMAFRGLTAAKARMRVQYALTDCIQQTTWTPFSPEGAAFPVVSFSDGELEVKGTVENRDGRVERIEFRYHPEDRRFVHGPKPRERQG